MLETAFESDFEDFAESDFEFESFDEGFDESFDEAIRRRRGGRAPSRPALRLPTRGNVMPRRPGPGSATKAELEATARRLDAKIATNAAAIKTLETRSRSMERELGSASAALKREIATRKKETADLKRGLDESRQIAMIMPLLGGGDDKFSKMLPIFLYGGMLGGPGTQTGDSNNSMMMTMMMVMALSD